MGILFIDKESYHLQLIHNCTWTPYYNHDPSREEECLMCANLWGTVVVLPYDTLLKLEEKYNRKAKVVMGG